MKNLTFRCFFIIGLLFFKGIHRKNKKTKIMFMSILIPKCVFFKTKNQNMLNPRVQFIMKITIFRKIKMSCNTKTLWKQLRKFWNFQCFDPKMPLQYHLRKFDKGQASSKVTGITEFAKGRHPQKSRQRSVWRVVQTLC